jgi:hypothetical protein
VKKKPILVNEEELEGLIDKLDLKDKKKNEYLKARWLNYVSWWDSRNGNQLIVSEVNNGCNT